MAEREAGDLHTPETARAAGVPFREPPERPCPFCGCALTPLGVALNGRIAWVGHKDCGCDGAQEEAKRSQEAKEAALLEESRRTRAAMLRGVGISRRFSAAAVDDGQCAAYLRRFGDVRGDGLYIYGGVGAGKTALANALAREFADAGYRVILTTTIGMLEKIQDTYGTEASSLKACHGYGECDVLVLDDLGKESASAWSMMTLFQVLNMRYEAMLPTIATTQYAPGAIAKRLGRGGERETAEAIASRLRGTMEVVHLAGGDRRIG